MVCECTPADGVERDGHRAVRDRLLFRDALDGKRLARLRQRIGTQRVRALRHLLEERDVALVRDDTEAFGDGGANATRVVEVMMAC